MKIDCGVDRPLLTVRELQRLERWHASAAAWREKRKHKTVWHHWYAWHPVRLADHDCRWFEWVERKLEYYGSVVKAVRTTSYRSL